MLKNLTRFYLGPDPDEYDKWIVDNTMPAPKVFEDIDTAVADCYETQLKESNIEYVRIDL